MIVRIRDDAKADLKAVFDWYESQQSGVGDIFLDAFKRATAILAEAPLRWPSHPLIHGVRRYRIDPYPFAIAYRIKDGCCEVYAIENLIRRPGYWRDRLHE